MSRLGIYASAISGNLFKPLTWNTATSATTNGAFIAYGNSTWVIGPYAAGSTYNTSTNGTSWTSRTSPGGEAGGWAGSYFALFVFGSTTFYKSTDGISWTSSSVSPAVSRSRYSGNLIIGGSRAIQAVNETFLEYATSTDGGNSWAKGGNSSGTGFNGTSMSYYNGTWIFDSEFANYSYSTNGGTSWTSASTPSGNVGRNYGGATGFIFKSDTASSTYYTSTNGTSWTSRSMPVSGVFAYAWDGGKWVAYGTTGTASYYSVDGISWTSATNSMASGTKLKDYYGQCVGGGKIVIPNYNSTTINWSEI